MLNNFHRMIITHVITLITLNNGYIFNVQPSRQWAIWEQWPYHSCHCFVLIFCTILVDYNYSVTNQFWVSKRKRKSQKIYWINKILETLKSIYTLISHLFLTMSLKILLCTFYNEETETHESGAMAHYIISSSIWNPIFYFCSCTISSTPSWNTTCSQSFSFSPLQS